MQLVEKRKTVEAFKWEGELYDLPSWAKEAQEFNAIKINVILGENGSWRFLLRVRIAESQGLFYQAVQVGEYIVNDGTNIKCMTEEQLHKVYE